MTAGKFECRELEKFRLFNAIIAVTLKIKDFEVHYLKLVVLQGYTQLRLMNKAFFNKNHIIEV